MPAWPGGPCPNCGEDMPANVVHCQVCRTLLNQDLDTDTIEMPGFIPLQEIASMVEVEPAGYFIECVSCARELRIGRRYIGERVACKFCERPFVCDLSNPKLSAEFFYANCPECERELRVARKYIGQKVACKHCSAKIHFVKQRSA